ncbi:MAG: acylphosphatase [Candidatus Micrarchaeota archaeon]
MALRLVLRGRVHGVNCRSFVKSIAFRMDLKGWVKNLSDGSVEVVVDGSLEELNEFKKKIFIKNPDSDFGLNVEEIIEEDVDEKDLTPFEIRF